MRLSQPQIQSVLLQAGWPNDPALLQTMSAIAYGESSGNTDALNSSGREYSVGLFQINLDAHPEYSEADRRDPVRNAQAALAIYNGQGFNAWGAYSNGSFRRYLDPSATPAPTSTPTASGTDVVFVAAVGVCALLFLKILRG